MATTVILSTEDVSQLATDAQVRKYETLAAIIESDPEWFQDQDIDDAEIIDGLRIAAKCLRERDFMLAALRTVGRVLAEKPITKKDDELWAAFSQVVAAVTKAQGRTP